VTTVQTKDMATANILTIPAGAGRAIIETAAVIACPILGTDNFIRFCRERGLTLDRARLLRLERLGLFAPIFRVLTPPDDDAQPFLIPVRSGNNWIDNGWAWDTTAVPASHSVPEDKDQSQEGYYSIFQLDYLQLILTELTLHVHMDGFIHPGERKEIDGAPATTGGSDDDRGALRARVFEPGDCADARGRREGGALPAEPAPAAGELT